MPKSSNTVLLGYQDELITEKYKVQCDYTLSKIGGEADFPPNFTTLERKPICKLCGIPSLLIIQIYAPLENSQYHRTLYLFACINSNCWNRTESWRCIRIETKKNNASTEVKEEASAPKLSTTDWCVDADDWGDDDSNENFVEENCDMAENRIEKPSDGEESSSLDESLQSQFVHLSVDEKNANNSPAQGSSGGYVDTPMATAEIEGGEEGVVAVETSTTPRTNLAALLQETMPLPGADSVHFVSFFISVWPEEEEQSCENLFDHHVKELLADYKQKDVNFLSSGAGEVGSAGSATEDYERSAPLHGDKMFHNFLTKIKANPEQILRYSREGYPLLLYPSQEPVKWCQYCQGEMIFEYQLIPTIISKLRLDCDREQCARLEFGTVLVYTCKRSCWPEDDSVKEEVVILQRENF